MKSEQAASDGHHSPRRLYCSARKNGKDKVEKRRERLRPWVLRPARERIHRRRRCLEFDSILRFLVKVRDSYSFRRESSRICLSPNGDDSETLGDRRKERARSQSGVFRVSRDLAPPFFHLAQSRQAHHF